MKRRILPAVAALATLAPVVACTAAHDDESAVGAVSSPLVVCSSSPPSGAWVCGQNRTIECASPNGTSPGPLYVVPIAIGDAGPPACNGATFMETPNGPLPLGTSTVVVRQTSDAGVVQACTSMVTVRDTMPPMAHAKDATLWPPNHSMHAVAITDCVEATDICDDHVMVHFTYVTSDEPVDAMGDGHSAPDVVANGCDSVELRSERQGGGDGRVYRLGWRAEDHSGNVTTGECRVMVPHDQSGTAAVDSGEAYRVTVCP
jgi:hypothetical protein